MNIHQSLELVLSSKETFGRVFYDIFLIQHPDVKQFFANLDMDRQAVVLTNSLSHILYHYVKPTHTTRCYLKELGRRHAAFGIPRDAYPKFRRAMIESLRTVHGREWDGFLEFKWTEAFDSAIAAMLEGYEAERT